ncbi:MAG: BatA domain-containing protein [Gemmatimonadaceae bacterium]
MGPLGWLAPALLAGLAALAVPIVLHLLQRERRQVVEFPSLMFLRRIPQETTRRRRIRHPLLLALRCLALALLAFAFARPFLRDRLAALPVAREARDVVILLDRSYSMGYGDRWSRAMAAAGQAVDELRGDDRATLVLFDQTAEAVTAATEDGALLRARLSTVTPGAAATRYAPALRLARDILAESDRVRREVVLVSDFQRGGWGGGADDLQLPVGTVVRRVDLSGAGADVAVAGTELTRTERDGREALAVAARLRATSADSSVRRATLELNGRAMQTVDVTLPVAGTVVARFAPVALPPGVVQGVVRLDADALPVNDTAHFVTARPRTLGVLVVQPTASAGRASLYLTRALALARDPAYTVTTRSASALVPADLDGRSLVVLNDVAPPQGAAGRRLAAYLGGGGGMIVALGESSRRARWAGPVADVAPLEVGTVRERGDGAPANAGSMGNVDRAHAIFAPFRDARDGGMAARVLRYRELRPDTGARVLASFDDGSPALVERAVGRGRLLVWASSLDDDWTDLPLQPAFLPFVHELARYAAGGTAAISSVMVGQRVDVARYAAELSGAGDVAGEAGARWLAIAPSGAREEVDGGGALEPREAGIYELRPMDGDGGAAVPLAVNVDPAEGDLTPLDSAALGMRGEEAGEGVAADDMVRTAAAAGLSDGEREARQGLWWPLLALAALLLAGEPMLANRLARRTR